MMFKSSMSQTNVSPAILLLKLTSCCGHLVSSIYLWWDVRSFMIHDVQVINVSKYVSPFLQQSYYLNWQVVTEVSIIQILVLIQFDCISCQDDSLAGVDGTGPPTILFQNSKAWKDRNAIISLSLERKIQVSFISFFIFHFFDWNRINITWTSPKQWLSIPRPAFSRVAFAWKIRSQICRN